MQTVNKVRCDNVKPDTVFSLFQPKNQKRIGGHAFRVVTWIIFIAFLNSEKHYQMVEFLARSYFERFNQYWYVFKLIIRRYHISYTTHHIVYINLDSNHDVLVDLLLFC